MTSRNLPRLVRINPIEGETPWGRLEGCSKERSIYEWRRIKTQAEQARGQATEEGRAILERHIANVASLIEDMEAL